MLQPAYVRWSCVVALVVLNCGSGAQEPTTPDVAQHEAQAANGSGDAELPPTALERCAAVGLRENSDEIRDCARRLVQALEADPSKPPPPGVNAARVVRGLNLGEACARYFPAESRVKHEQGTVVLIVYVGTDGLVKMMLLRESSGVARLDQAAASCLSIAGRFEPALIDGEPVGSWQRIKWTWRLAR